MKAIKKVAPQTGEEIAKLINSLLVAQRKMETAKNDFDIWAEYYVDAGDKLLELGLPWVTGHGIYKDYLIQRKIKG